MSGDTVIYPVLDAVRTAAAEQLGATGRPVCDFVIYLADHSLPADECDCVCEGAQGVGWVRLVSSTAIMPGAAIRAPESPCEGAALLLTVELGVHRCAPTLAEGERTVPAQRLEDYSQAMSCDLSALHRAFLCAHWIEEYPWRVTALHPVGPMGGCASAVATAQVVRESCCPLVLSVTWAPHGEQPLTVEVTVDGFGQYGATVDFGDGSPPLVMATAGVLTHTYPAPGRYLLSAADRMVPTASAHTTLTVHDGTPAAHVFVDGWDPWSMLLWVDEPATEMFTVDWGDGSAPELLNGQAGTPPAARARHTYDRVGRFPITVTDVVSRRSVTVDSDAGDLGVTVNLAGDDHSVPTVDVLWLAVGSLCELSWDGGPPVSVVVGPFGRVTHTSAAPLPAGTHQLRITEVLDDHVRRTVTRLVTVPDRVDDRLGVVLSWAPLPGGHLRGSQTVTVIAPGARGPCTVDWGDGSTPAQLPADGMVEHAYSVPIRAAGYVLRVGENAAGLGTGELPRVFTRAVGPPRYVGAPMLSTREPGAVDLNVAGLAGTEGFDTYRVTWGDGSAPELAAAGGAWYPAGHTYPTDGDYVITVDGPGMPQPAQRTVTVVRYPEETP